MEEVCFKVKQSKSTLASTLAQVESEEVQYRLCMVGSLSVHPLTTMPMLPWILAEIRKPQTVEKNRSTSPSWPHSGSTILDQPVMLHITATCVWCVLDIAGPGKPWDPLQHALLWQHQPHQITKLIHNSQDPSYFCCLARQEGHATCHVFHCEDQHKVPEIISTLRQASKSSERLEESTAAESALSSSCQDDKHHCDAVSPNAITFAKKFEVLFCGRVVVAHRKAPPALIDECIEKFSRATGGIGGLAAGIRRVLSLQPTANGVQMGSGEGNLSRKPAFFQRDPSLPSLQAQDENGLSLELQNRSVTGACGVRPTSILENRTMLFTVGRSQIFLVSPDTKKVAIEKSFREISFCSQGIRHVDHFGFICRESSESGTCQFVCYVFQCTDESLVDEIMLTLKQAFSVAAQQQVSQTHGQQCENCPMLTLHRVCERIEGVHPSKAKLELQRHLATLDSQEQTAVFQITMKARPKSDQEENELLVSCLRRLYEEKQKSHTHTYNKQSAVAEEKGDAGLSGSRLRLEQFKSRAKRSLTESLEGIWKGGNKSKCQSEGDFSSSDSTLNNSNQDPSLDDPLCSPLALSSPLRSHNSTGDLKRLESGSPLQETQQPAFRRRASTIGHSPTQCSPSGPLGPPQQPSAATKPKLVRHYSVSTDSPHQSNDVAALSSPGAMCVVGEDSPIRSHRYSWRQQIFLRVATPQKGTDTTDRGDCALDVGGALALGGVSGSGLSADGQLGSVPEERRRRSGPEIRELWRKAILQQILLLRMERENQKLQASENDRQSRRLKLDYEEITPCLKDVTLVWERMLGTPGRAKVKFDTESIHSAVGRGVPRQHRGEIWKLLSEQYNLRQQVPSKSPSTDTPYKELLKQLTSQQHAILIDLGRTFPTHPYFSTQLGAGQLSLYNLLKAYSLLDPEVGYCQGLSFVAGVLLLHMGEEEAFTLLKFLMYDMGLRKQYRPDMIILQIQMYQLSRLLHDYHRELYNHLEKYEIGPSLYAAPWFLTAFASHFPLGFVARVFDMLFLQGSEVIFKVALSLLGSHKPLILQHDSLESIVDFIKTTLPNLGLVQMEKTINQVFEMDISKQLQAYEVEYHVLQDELVDNISTLNQSQRTAQLEKTNCSLRQQNMDLLEELQVAHAKIHWLETRVEGLVTSENALQKEMCGLQQDKASLQATVSHLQTQMLDLGLPLDFGPEHYHQDSDPNQLHNQNQPQRASPKL
ncbi:TBC1 domain family member 1 isoform X2 [Sardina pilchardus]|uniref:TBC1 domain family member 1 isoform X2 n=1 Tax=Sardina pilchardus TaxID=27697 RepID=UPI002E0E2FE2